MGSPGAWAARLDAGQTQETVASAWKWWPGTCIGPDGGGGSLAHPSWLASVLERRELVGEGWWLQAPPCRENVAAPAHSRLVMVTTRPQQAHAPAKMRQAAEMRMRYWPSWAICTRSGG